MWREHGKTQYLGQMDLNVKSELVWEFYRETLEKLASYGAVIVRLDAFAYTSKEVGKRNFFNEPQTWEILERLTEMADQYGITLLPEIHAGYAEKRYLQVAEKGYVTYDFFLPGLIIDAIENKDGSYLKRWADEIIEKDIQVVNMLGCHDGIPILDLKGLLPEERIQKLTDVVISRGGRIKDLHGAENVYYQVNATYYSALGEDDDKMCLARAIQMFMPAKPQVWYLDIFAGKNDYEAVERAEEGGHKEINRTNLTMKEMEKRLKKDVVIRQLELIRLRNTNPAFDGSPTIAYRQQENILSIRWSNKHEELELTVDFNTCKYWICGQ